MNVQLQEDPHTLCWPLAACQHYWKASRMAAPDKPSICTPQATSLGFCYKLELNFRIYLEEIEESQAAQRHL